MAPTRMMTQPAKLTLVAVSGEPDPLPAARRPGLSDGAFAASDFALTTGAGSSSITASFVAFALSNSPPMVLPRRFPV